MSLTINALLLEAGINLSRTKLVRHADADRVSDMFSAWLNQRNDFEAYQAVQSKSIFNNVDHVVSFVRTREGDLIFVGVYQIHGWEIAKGAIFDKLTQTYTPAGCTIYDLRLTDVLSDLIGRLVVDWSRSALAWHQWAVNVKPIVELRRHVTEPPFPGFQHFSCELAGVPGMPIGWRAALGQVHGCYVLTQKSTGKLYVGAAYGAEGFYSRWLTHATKPDPVHLKGISAQDLLVSILEVTDVVWGSTQALDAEAHWKRILRSALN